MDNTDTIRCFNEVKASFLNTQSTEELSLITPRDIRSTVKSWATKDTDKERAEQMVFEWLKQYRKPKPELRRTAKGYIVHELNPTDENCTLQEKHNLLIKTLSHAKKGIDFILKDKDHVKCDAKEYRENMEWFLECVLPSTNLKEKRLLNQLEKIGYNFIDDINGYPYLFSFLWELMWYEYYLCNEIIPDEKKLKSLNRKASFDGIDDELLKRLEYYRTIGIRNKHRHGVTINSDKWAIPFEDFAELYRKILGLSNKAITSPLT